MVDQDSSEYPLADLPDPPPRPSPPSVPPMPRLWKAEADPVPAETAATQGKARSSPEKGSGTGSCAPEGPGKKALVEPTPALDTLEARQRARLIVSGLSILCALLFSWIFYRLFLHDPNDIAVPADDPTLTLGPPEPKRDLEAEARVMVARARGHARGDRVTESVALLEQVVKVYPATVAAGEAREALGRSRQKQPLFPDRVEPETKSATTPRHETRAAETLAGSSQTGSSEAAGEVLPTSAGTLAKHSDGSSEATPPETPAVALEAVRMAPAPAIPLPPPRRVLPPGFAADSSAGVHPSGWPLVIVGERDGATMALVPGGVFSIGNDQGAASDGPAQRVRLSSFYIDRHEVTLGQFRRFLRETRYRGQPPTRAWAEDRREGSAETLPMVMVNARDAAAYATWAGKRLPTEAEWESAARGLEGHPFPWGSEPVAFSRPRKAREVYPVMSFPEDCSPFGIFDLGGNVREWTQDWYDPRGGRRRARTILDNPTGPRSRPRSQEVVVKGGATNGAAAAREGIPLEKRLPDLGFRCVLEIEGEVRRTLPTPFVEPLIPDPREPARSLPPPAPTDGGGGVVPF
jgi:sulfatase modifying factor 1